MTICPTVALFTCLLMVGQMSWLLLSVFPLLLLLVLLLVELLWLVSSWLLFKIFCCTLLMAQDYPFNGPGWIIAFAQGSF